MLYPMKSDFPGEPLSNTPTEKLLASPISLYAVSIPNQMHAHCERLVPFWLQRFLYRFCFLLLLSNMNNTVRICSALSFEQKYSRPPTWAFGRRFVASNTSKLHTFLKNPYLALRFRKTFDPQQQKEKEREREREREAGKAERESSRKEIGF